MREAGFRVVRIVEFSGSITEPEAGRVDVGWLEGHRAADRRRHARRGAFVCG